MKYALSFFFMSFFIATFSTDASARSITSFRQSDSISAVAEFMYDVGEDLPVSTRMSDKKINVKDISKCVDVTSKEVLDDVDSAIRKVMRFYPDEELPFEEALSDALEGRISDAISIIALSRARHFLDLEKRGLPPPDYR